MVYHFGKEAWRTFERGCEREWLVTNGLGGFASGTLVGANTRRYHGLLVAALNPPVRRCLLLAKLDERLTCGGVTYNLATNCTRDGVTERGFTHLQHVKIDPFPTFTYRCGLIWLEKTVFMPRYRNATVILYRLSSGSGPAELRLWPLVNYRDYHGNTYCGTLSFRQENVPGGVVIWGPEGLPPLFLQISRGAFHPSPDWYYGMYYPAEAERGLNPYEDHYLPGYFTVFIPPEEEIEVVVTASLGEVLEPAAAEGFLREARRHLEEVVCRAGRADPLARELVRAADAFLVRRSCPAGTSVIAGYPWFTDWGRDALISLPGLTLVTGRFAEAKEILLLYGSAVKEGLVPNFFPDEGEPWYNSVDASLWYLYAVQQYWRYTGDEEFVWNEAWPVMMEILRRYVEGTRYGIRMDLRDGLLRAGEPGVQLTWMDAKVGDWVITPRQGKPVEVNALWYNAVRFLEELSGRWNLPFPYSGLGDKIREGFKKFWCPEGYLADVIDDEGRRDLSFRPNQILAVSLPHSPLTQEQARAVVKRVEEELYTPYGLRSLSPRDPAYRGRYVGDVLQRDAAYHQGTVWSWLIGPFITAYRKVFAGEKAAHRQIRRFFDPFRAHLGDHGVGYVSEIFDGDDPFLPRGCFAQAWGVAEVLRAYVEDFLEVE
ncbi:amylo-alpha-1,6-glucosidase [Ammonifex thiophilus]|uniref:Glycogen debranching protein n=1 Tax=Ammonifex thiophilus TaxID=444093 RepID=A0A3D8P4R5_9THEO|nr:amylo-alpha-1,6-glucosidase [Ammonifex thiophilus]RDV84194.1 glycogen debranching protein [Ammonifex thiophilus]